MARTEPDSVPPQDAARIIRREIQALGDRVRIEHPWLAHQDALGTAVFLVSIAAILAMATLYAYGLVPAYVVIPVSAFFMSLLHELEHDLIHRLYWKSSPRMHAFMMAGVWLFRPNTINPWLRQKLHLHHHRVSGEESDLEERAITNGEPWGIRRFLMMADGMLSVYLRPRELRRIVRAFIHAQQPTEAERKALARANWLAYAPLGTFHYTLVHAFVLYHGTLLVASALGATLTPPELVVDIMDVVGFLMVVWLGPNVLRSFCLHFVSSNIHYFGDIESGNVVQQTQVWTAGWLLPFHLFCFNFGGTHAIHHFVVRDPFYIRQMIAKDAQAVMRRGGVRFDDFGTFTRANRWRRRALVASAA